MAIKSPIYVRDYGLRSANVRYIDVCPNCKEKYKKFYNEIEYEHNGKKFCSWNCKREYQRKEEKEKWKLS